jgi:hypothetical protein
MMFVMKNVITGNVTLIMVIVLLLKIILTLMIMVTTINIAILPNVPLKT